MKIVIGFVVGAFLTAMLLILTEPEEPAALTYPERTVITYECAANAVKFLRDEKPGSIVLCANGTDVAYIQKEITARSSR